jgi:hypothetical protein
MVNLFKARIYFMIIRHYFILEQFDDCITWTNKMMELQQFNPDKRIHAATIFIDIICHLELHHEQLVLSKIRAAQSYFTHHNQLNQALKSMFRQLNRLAAVLVAAQKSQGIAGAEKHSV